MDDKHTDKSLSINIATSSKKRKYNSSSESSSLEEKYRKHKKHKGKHRKKLSRSSSESSDEKRKKKKKKSKHKSKKDKEKTKTKEKVEDGNKSSQDCLDVPISLMTANKEMAPMTKTEWEKKQSITKKVFDESTGRYRLIKGDGEVLEEIVSKEKHKEINQQATRGDGAYFESRMSTSLKK